MRGESQSPSGYKAFQVTLHIYDFYNVSAKD